MKRRWNKISRGTSILVLMMFSSIVSFSQSSYKVLLQDIRETGFYKIMITPDIAAKSNPGLSDFRIFSEDGKQVPYILKREKAFISQQALEEFPVIAQLTKDSLSELVVETTSPAKDGEYSLVLTIHKAVALRTARVSGSNDNTTWYAIVDNFIIGKNSNNGGAEYLEFVPIAANNYRYLKISIFDKGLPPLNISKIGRLQTQYIQGNYTALPSPRILQKDSSNKKSYVTLQFEDSYPIAKLNLAITGTALYRRTAYAYDTLGYPLGDAILMPNSDSVLLSGRKEKKVLLIIENEDNEPLTVKNVLGWQLEEVAIASLQNDTRYYIETGNKGASQPIYDLRFFSESILPLEEIIIPKTLEPVAQKQETKVSEKINKGWIWVFIIIALLCLLLLSYKLLQNIPKNQNDRS